MSTDTELVVLIAILHLIALAAGGGLLLLALSSGNGYADAHHTRGTGGEPPPDPPTGPVGGPPLAVAAPARVRMREPVRLADLLPRVPRRGTREPRRSTPRPLNPRR
jgi:hypothetical protein